DEEDKKEEEHLALADPFDVSTDDLETMATVNQGMSVEEIERVLAQRVANAIEAISIYETKTNLARNSNQQNKGHKVPRAHTAWPINKKAYAGSPSLCNQCKFHHNGSCTVKCGNCKKVGHTIQNCITPTNTKNQRTRTCYECGSLRYYKGEYPIVKFHKRMDMTHERVRASKPKTMQDAIENATKLMNKKISALAECQTENKKRLDNTSKNNQNQQQPNKRQNTGRAYTARHGEKKLMADLSHCVLNATITMMVHVLLNATSATELAI
nr:reverse transcriptase domain-containing protein [Tanacetum cinerariifolium]